MDEPGDLGPRARGHLQAVVRNGQTGLPARLNNPHFFHLILVQQEAMRPHQHPWQ